MTATENTIIGLLEKTVLKRGRVTGIRPWEPGTFLEIDLHLPGTDMSRWEEAQHIKCRVSSYTFRDYTPAGWDAPTRTCTLYIDAAHEGPGSRWARAVREGDAFYYAGVSRTLHPPSPLSHIVCLGDESSVGHFLALQQLLPRSSSISGAVLVREDAHRCCFGDFLRLPIEPVEGGESALAHWVLQREDLLEDAVFYLVGHTRTVRELRRVLRESGVEPERVKAQGFWS